MSQVIREFQGFLSNFLPCQVKLGDEKLGKLYPSVEHAYQASKFWHMSGRDAIRLTKSAGEAKRFATQRKKAWRQDWNDNTKLRIMENLLRQKFSPKSELAEKLKNTWPAELLHGSSSPLGPDTFWGISLITGEGSNHLGRLLMQIRYELKLNETTIRGGPDLQPTCGLFVMKNIPFCYSETVTLVGNNKTWLGAEMYQPELENIYEGLGIPQSKRVADWEDDSPLGRIDEL